MEDSEDPNDPWAGMLGDDSAPMTEPEPDISEQGRETQDTGPVRAVLAYVMPTGLMREAGEALRFEIGQETCTFELDAWAGRARLNVVEDREPGEFGNSEFTEDLTDGSTS